jgi:hypothetical protein
MLSAQNKKSRAKQRGTSKKRLEVGGTLLWRAVRCLAVYFTWPQVALTHHVFAQKRLYPRLPMAVKRCCLSELLERVMCFNELAAK